MTRPRLGRFELHVLTRVWDHPETTIKEVWEPLYRERGLAYTSVASVLKKLEEKGYVEHVERERTYYYSPIVGREDVCHGMLRELLDNLFDGSASRLVAALFHSKDLSERDLEDIERLINEQRNGR